MKRLLQAFWHWLAQVGAHPADDPELRMRKTLFVAATLLGDILSSVLFSGMYFSTNEPRAGAVMLVWLVLAVINLCYFSFRKVNFRWAATRELLLTLLMPLPVSLALGGVINSGFMPLISLIAPFGALIFLGLRDAPKWVLGFFGVLILSAGLEPIVYSGTTHLTNVLVGLVLNLAAFTLVIFLVLYYFIRQRDEAFRLLYAEQEKSETLLLNILPRDIARILKNEQRVIADSFDGASILFADVVNFTPLSAQLTPVELVTLLNEIFTHFDSLVEHYGLEKIKTIGDCYMVAAGVPRARPDHAQVLTQLALEMLAYVAQREFQGRKLMFRIGINSGPVVAGVIGRKKFIYDLWGDTVNTASRMEAHGVGGTVQVTQATYALIQADFDCEARGRIEVKGKGPMEVWQVRHAKAKSAQVDKIT